MGLKTRAAVVCGAARVGRVQFYLSTAINQLEMWQTYPSDLATIDRELGWAPALGFNTVHVPARSVVG